MNDAPEHQQLTEVEAELQLAKIRADNLLAQERIAEQQQKINAAQAERKQVAFHENLARAVAGTGLKTASSVDQKDFIEALQLTMKFDVKADGTFDVVDRKGKPVEFADAFRQWASERTFWFDGRSLKRLETSPDDLCKSDMTTAEKAQYISKHGLDAFEKIPNVPKAPPPNVATMTSAEYTKLDAGQKAKLINKLGIAGIEEILLRRK